MTISSRNPATGDFIQAYEELDEHALDAKLQAASEAFDVFRRTTVEARTAILVEAATILEREADAFGRLMTAEMGKLVTAGRDEALKSARGCRYYAAHAGRLLADEPVEMGAARAFVRYDPLGPILAVMPWNFPFWQVFRFAAPALAAGNVVLLKHASNVPGCALAIDDLFRRAGCPAGVFQSLLVSSSRVERLIGDDRIAAVTLTGSEEAGVAVATAAGRALKKVVLELGGSDPFIVLPSADVEGAARAAVAARTVNAGQSCVAAKRFIVAEPVADLFERRFVAHMGALRVGDPLDPATDVGPLASAAAVRDLSAQVDRAVRAGARVLIGGHPVDRPGHFYAPTVVTDIAPDSPLFGDETFGPVAALFRVPDVTAAIRLANATRFGLGCSVWTNDPAEQQRLIREIDAGLVFVNAMVVSDPRLPFGGVKRSGHGRELGSYGIREFVNVKTVSVAS